MKIVFIADTKVAAADKSLLAFASFDFFPPPPRFTACSREVFNSSQEITKAIEKTKNIISTLETFKNKEINKTRIEVRT